MRSRFRHKLASLAAITIVCLTTAVSVHAGIPNEHNAQARQYTRDVYISTGDNHYLGASLAIDSPKSIADAFDMLKDALGTRRIYWRGLQEATTIATLHARDENFRYRTALEWFEYLITDLKIEPLAAKLAHERGMEFWGVGTLGDWGCRPDTPGFNDFPWFWESTLRIENPEWVPVDKYGYRKQGGTIELAYPEARKALVDLHTRLAVEAGYDGILLLTYVENFSQRYQDEFGYSEPIVQEFKRRYRIDIRHEPFTKFASREDWYKLRGEYVTQYLRELKASLGEHGIKLGMSINPRSPRKPGNWATLMQPYWTLGNIHFDLETWVQEGLVDELVVYGASDRRTQAKTVSDLLWLTRDTHTEISLVTSSPAAPGWETTHSQGVPTVFTIGEDEDYFLRGGFPTQTVDALSNGTDWQVMGYLSQIIRGKSKAPSAAVLPYLKRDNVLMRRLAVHALGIIGDPETVPAIEALLDDPENGVRCKAMQSLRYNNRPESAIKILEALDKHGNHPLHEMARDTLPRIQPKPLEQMINAFDHPSEIVRTTAVRASRYMGPRSEHVPAYVRKLDDSHRYTRYAAAFSLGEIKDSEAAIDALIQATTHDDVAVSTRAAASIETVVARGDNSAQKKRKEMLDALTSLFTQMGDNNTRSDYEWGYRPVGNALLAFGEEGEAVLLKYMRQSKDRRLAELAWRILYIREKSGPNAFNIITEKESDDGFKHRPAWLKTHRSPKLQTNFDAAPFAPAARGNIGDANVLHGRWGGFSDTGPLIDNEIAYSGQQSLKVIRGGNSIAGYTTATISNDNDYELTLQIHRDQPDSSMLIYGKGRTPSVTDEWGVFIDTRGHIRLRQMDKGKWIDTSLILPAQQWVQLRIVVSRIHGEYTAAITLPDGGEHSSAISLPIAAVKDFYRVDLIPQAPEGTSVHIDDFALEERP